MNVSDLCSLCCRGLLFDKSSKQSQTLGIHSSSFWSDSANKHKWVNVKETLAQLKVVSTAIENFTKDIPTGSSRNKSITKYM